MGGEFSLLHRRSQGDLNPGFWLRGTSTVAHPQSRRSRLTTMAVAEEQRAGGFLSNAFV